MWCDVTQSGNNFHQQITSPPPLSQPPLSPAGSGGHQDPNVCLSRFISSCASMPRWWLNSIKPLSLCKTPREIRTQAIKHVIWKLLLIYFWCHLWVFSKMIPTSHTVNMSFSITIQQQQQDSEDNFDPVFVEAKLTHPCYSSWLIDE